MSAILAKANVSKNYSNGVDDSRWQKIIAWYELDPCIDFAIIKVCEGAAYPDAYFERNWQTAGDLNIPRNGYHYFKGDKDPKRQAKFYAHLMAGHEGLGHWLDVETNAGLNKVQLENALLKYLDCADELGFHFGIYTSAGFWNKYLPRTDWAKKRRLWVASWCASWWPANSFAQPTLPLDWSAKAVQERNPWYMWQWSSKGKLPGIAGNVDLDRLNRPLIELG